MRKFSRDGFRQFVDDMADDRRRHAAMRIIKRHAGWACAIRRSIVLPEPDIRGVRMLPQPIHRASHDKILEVGIGEADSPVVVGVVDDTFAINHGGPFRMRLEDFRAHETP